ncbi:hypothetical protein Q5692_25335 [Microcoleus sp. C2C3]|uniref:hypothetical protein n=1 Tax=unclassified Microcoleus TaxID=2642155 RepID=UPI002FD136C6
MSATCQIPLIAFYGRSRRTGCMRLTESGRVRSVWHNLRMILVECPACFENTLDGRDAHPTG